MNRSQLFQHRLGPQSGSMRLEPVLQRHGPSALATNDPSCCAQLSTGLCIKAQVGNLFMSLIHTRQLCGANSFVYLTELQYHARELAASPAQRIHETIA